MRVGLIRDECLTYSICAKGDTTIEVMVDIPVQMQREIKTIEKAFWSAQTTLEKLYERARKEAT
jgi:hypothetical protein